MEGATKLAFALDGLIRSRVKGEGGEEYARKCIREIATGLDEALGKSDPTLVRPTSVPTSSDVVAVRTFLLNEARKQLQAGGNNAVRLACDYAGSACLLGGNVGVVASALGLTEESVRESLLRVMQAAS